MQPLVLKGYIPEKAAHMNFAEFRQLDKTSW